MKLNSYLFIKENECGDAQNSEGKKKSSGSSLKAEAVSLVLSIPIVTVGY